MLPDSHKFVTSAYLLKKYFADLFGEPAPKKHPYCRNCLGRIRIGQVECLKDKCRDGKKKIENFLELDLHLRLCQLYRGKGSLLSDKLLNKPFISNLLQNNVIPPVSYDFKPPSFNFGFLIMHVLIYQSFSRFHLRLKLITIDLSITSRYFYC